MSPWERFRAVRFFGSLDGLRAISIIGVIWVHSWLGTPYFPRIQSLPVLGMGEFGVSIFFAISGFLITTLLLREQTKFGEISLRNFYIRRGLRIWPAYYATLAIYVALALVTERHSERGTTFFHYLPSYLTYTYTWFRPMTGDNPIFNFAWSLATEEQFYLFWPFMIALLRKPWPLLVMLGLISLRIVAGTALLHPFVKPEAFPSRVLISVSLPICIGSIIAIALHSRLGFDVLYKVLGKKWSAPVALIVLGCLLIPGEHAWWPVQALVAVALVGACVIREDNGLARLLQWKPLALMGVLSYGMYLFNTLCVKVLRPTAAKVGLHHPLALFPLILLATMLVAWLSYRYFETPFLSMKKRFERIPSGRAETTTAPAPVPIT